MPADTAGTEDCPSLVFTHRKRSPSAFSRKQLYYWPKPNWGCLSHYFIFPLGYDQAVLIWLLPAQLMEYL